MKKEYCAAGRLALGAILVLVLGGCYPIMGPLIGSGNPVTRDMDITGFDAVDASSAFQLEITQSDSYNVSVTADDNVWSRVQVNKEGGTLRLGLQPGSFTNATLRAEISMPVLSRLSLSGASTATITRFTDQPRFDAELSGASSLSGDIQAGSAGIDLSGSSKASLTGSAGSLTLEASGASNANLADFTVNTGTVSLSGASKADVDVKSTLDYDLSGASDLTYAGGPQIGNDRTSGASHAQPR